MKSRISRHIDQRTALLASVTEGAADPAKLVEAFPNDIQTITLGKPTLEDVFIARTGHRFFGEVSADVETPGKKKRKGRG